MAMSKSSKSVSAASGLDSPSRSEETVDRRNESCSIADRGSSGVLKAGPPFAFDFPITLTATVQPEEDGGYSAAVPALPGCFTEADTLDELRANLIEVAEGWLLVKQEMEAMRAEASAEDQDR